MQILFIICDMTFYSTNQSELGACVSHIYLTNNTTLKNSIIKNFFPKLATSFQAKISREEIPAKPSRENAWVNFSSTYIFVRT